MAIEIAASMCRTLPCRQVAALVAERIDALEVHAPDIPVRQRRMSLVFAFAWERLSETQRQILHALCVFRAGFTVDAAVAVCTHDGVLNTTTVMQALELFVLHTSVAQHGQRYTLHPMLRQYVLETRGQVPADLAAAAAETFLALLADPDLRRVQVATMLVCERLEPEYQNIAASWDWAVRAGKGSGLGAHARALYTLSICIGHVPEVADMLAAAARRSDELAAAAELRIWEVRLRFRLGEFAAVDAGCAHITANAAASPDVRAAAVTLQSICDACCGTVQRPWRGCRG